LRAVAQTPAGEGLAPGAQQSRKPLVERISGVWRQKTVRSNEKEKETTEGTKTTDKGKGAAQVAFLSVFSVTSVVDSLPAAQAAEHIDILYMISICFRF
jgi:hypothetical protein